MAPLLKLTLSFSLLASTALAAHSPKDGSRGHIKMVKRTVQHDKRHDKGPYGYGYDRVSSPAFVCMATDALTSFILAGAVRRSPNIPLR